TVSPATFGSAVAASCVKPAAALVELPHTSTSFGNPATLPTLSFDAVSITIAASVASRSDRNANTSSYGKAGSSTAGIQPNELWRLPTPRMTGKPSIRFAVLHAGSRSAGSTGATT